MARGAPMLAFILALATATEVLGQEAKELSLYDTPRQLPTTRFADADGKPVEIADFAGKVAVMDFWATWCLPCRTEVPALDRLQKTLGAHGLEVVMVSLDLKGKPAVQDFYDELHVKNLKIYFDQGKEFTEAMGVRYLPTTVVIDRTGREAGRVEGPLVWDRPEVLAKLDSLLAH